MNDDPDFDQIESLLRRPAVIADRGFSERVALQTIKLSKARRKLFLITGLCWFVLILLAASPQAIYTDIVMLAQSLDIGGFYPTAITYIQSVIASPEQLPFTAIAATILSFAAVASMAIRA